MLATIKCKSIIAYLTPMSAVSHIGDLMREDRTRERSHIIQNSTETISEIRCLI